MLTPHERTHACDQVDDFGLDAGIGTVAERWVVGGWREVDCKGVKMTGGERGGEAGGGGRNGEFDILRARNRSSDKIAMALMRRTETGTRRVYG